MHSCKREVRELAERVERLEGQCRRALEAVQAPLRTHPVPPHPPDETAGRNGYEDEAPPEDPDYLAALRLIGGDSES